MDTAACRADLAYDVFSRQCPSRGTLEHVTGRWGALTLGALHDEHVPLQRTAPPRSTA